MTAYAICCGRWSQVNNQNFEKLEVYQDALKLANQVYETTKSFPRDELFGMTNQLRTASTSIACNIAEGSSRGKKEFVHFLNMAVGSAYECVPLLEISKKQNYVPNELFSELIDNLHRISAKINALKNSLKQ
jgi:four helix bundle protein